jgi:hypothetical protein
LVTTLLLHVVVIGHWVHANGGGHVARRNPVALWYARTGLLGRDMGVCGLLGGINLVDAVFAASRWLGGVQACLRKRAVRQMFNWD